ncbi:flagellar basal body protein FliL [Paenibacillus sambharensis]|uniref:Flagellar protein FliL n=1 Tax=Paenibacillus sambharensis TaxID=1803190 RepID=A0A2W1LNF4_9BACL|nr:flagellar basal body-associated FliL family protein [Paenibacillus sambharensis]PZD93331.1 flagellar basal body protein FliL [Paenibacillus sambharensis]
MKKMLPWLITILLAIALIAVVAVFLYNQFMNSEDDPALQAEHSVHEVEPKKLSADERVEMTTEIQDIKTNLLDTDYLVVMSFAFQLDDKKSKEEFDKIKDIQIKPIIIRALADMMPEELKGSQGKDALSAKLINAINKELSAGKVTKVEVTNFIVTMI